ncbi:class I SAM-dependent methyltransferase [candidate division WS5 bacterium]|uniref:Class I SAM-dependent methyltransferase n=1 Tax=candidate division WS5 bacterium TaxID=2093353 RepID=A0A419DBR5_9BACT|nr:MAG: class I SAM-dependent methyltransferase [candidate division WS5 bacterium]
MKNITGEKANRDLRGRLLETVNFVSKEDLEGKDILDIGCGYGWFELNALNRGVSKITAMEVTENDLKTIKTEIKDKKVDFRVGSATKLPFEDNKFDTAVCWEVVEHIPKNEENIMLNEIHRVLKSNGVLYLTAPNNSFFANILDPAWFFGHRHYGVHHLRDLVSDKFQITDLQVKGGLWSVLGILNMYVSKWVFRRKPIFKEFFNKKEDVEYKGSQGFVNIFLKCQRKKV